MNKTLLDKHIKHFLDFLRKEPKVSKKHYQERLESMHYYQSFTEKKILGMSKEDIYEYISKLWAMLIWGNKHYVVNKVIEDNGFDYFKEQLAGLVWGKKPIETRWDTFRK